MVTAHLCSSQWLKSWNHKNELLWLPMLQQHILMHHLEIYLFLFFFLKHSSRPNLICSHPQVSSLAEGWIGSPGHHWVWEPMTLLWSQGPRRGFTSEPSPLATSNSSLTSANQWCLEFDNVEHCASLTAFVTVHYLLQVVTNRVKVLSLTLGFQVHQARGAS